jgi:hypothetical protein
MAAIGSDLKIPITPEQSAALSPLVRRMNQAAEDGFHPTILACPSDDGKTWNVKYLPETVAEAIEKILTEWHYATGKTEWEAS